MFDDADCLNRYRRTMAEQPELFANVPGCPIRIVTAPAEIASVREAVRAQRAAEGHHGDDLRVGILAEDHFIGSVIRDAVLFPNGEPALYNRVVATGGIAALPIIDDGIALIRIFRHALRRWSLEAPQGIARPGFDPADEARRELVEEMEAVVSDIVALGQLNTSTALTSERLTLFATRISAMGRPSYNEGIAGIERIACTDIDARIADGTICDGPSIALITHARLRGLI